MFHMGCEYCSMSYNVKICQNQQLMCTCCEGDPLHPSAYYRLGFCGRPSVCVRFFSQTHMTYYTHKTDIFSICCHAAVHKPGENQAQNSASKKKKTQTFAPLHKKCILWSSSTNLSLCIRTQKHVCEITLLYTQFLTLSTIPHSHPLTKKCAKRHSHTNKTHTGFSCERWL